MISFDMLTLVGILTIIVVGVILFTLCRLRGCNKPLC